MTYFAYPRYRFRRPPELDRPGTRRPVVVVGAGPVGLCAALGLARGGVPVVALDPKGSVSEGSRALCLSRASLEILRRNDAHRPFVAKGLAWTHGSSYFRDRLVYRLEMPHSDDERFAPMTNLQQQYIEQFLVERADAERAIELRWHSEVVGVQARVDGVRMAVRTPDGDYELDADWLLAADGARSFVRQALGLKLKGEAYEGRYLIADVHAQLDLPTERRAYFDPPCNEGATVLVHRQPDGIWRIDYQLRDEEDAEAELQPGRVRARVGEILAMLGVRGPWTLEWHSLYRAYTLALDDYRHGRVLFVGDSAHLVPIFGVRGLNSGFADADNAAWKLAAVLRGEAPERLLDSYTPERRAATLETFATAGRSTRFMTPPTRGYRLLHRAALELAVANDCTRPLINPRQSVPYDYVDSPLTSPGDDAAFAAGPRAGAPLRNVRLGADDYFLDHLGDDFALVVFGDRPPDGSQALVARLRAGAPRVRCFLVGPAQAPAGWCAIADPGGRIAALYDALPGTAYLSRPDGHVASRWRDLALADVGRAIDAATGRTA